MSLYPISLYFPRGLSVSPHFPHYTQLPLIDYGDRSFIVTLFLNNHLQWVGLLTGAPASINTCTSSAKPALQASWSACQFPWEVTDAPARSKTLTISTYLPVTAHISGDRPNLSTSSKDEPACKRIFTMSRWPVEAATWMGSFLRCSVY